ncbi:MAG: hypothetical protein ACKVS9_12805, partial [Phycisphaerae bacterium]
MSKQTPDKLEQTLAMLSSPSDKPTQLWKQALAEVDSQPIDGRNGALHIWAKRNVVWLTRVGVAAAIVVIVGVTWSLDSAAGLRAKVASISAGVAAALHTYSNENTEWFRYGTPWQFLSPSTGDSEDHLRNGIPADQPRSLGYVGDSAEDAVDGAVTPRRGRFDPTAQNASLGGRAGRGAGSFNTAASDAPPPNAARHVIRKASLELRSPDVRALFAKVPLVLNEGLGEFVQDSSLTGTTERPEASLTLRVAADRLSAVL